MISLEGNHYPGKAFAEFAEKAPPWIASDFSTLRARYEKYRSWYSGEALDAVLTDDEGDNYELYPLRINPLPRACEKHAQALIGEDRNGDAISVYIYNKDGERIDAVEDAISFVMASQDIDELVLTGALAAQVDGGVFLVVRWSKQQNGEFGISLDVVDAAHMYCIPSSNGWSLNEAWLVRDIDAAAAEEYGVHDTDNEVVAYYEHWTRKTHELYVDGKRIVTKLPTGDVVEEPSFGLVPVVYIPHERKAGEFWGRSLITDAAIGLIKEINLRFADYGDAVARDANDIIAIRNVQSSLSPVRISRTSVAINLGSSSGIPGKQSEPDMFAVGKPRASAPMNNLVSELYKALRREIVIPAVADGEDEGSQRSSLTLETRFWPLTTHVRAERRHWSRGIKEIVYIIARILVEKGEITQEDYASIARVRVDFGDILPRDREQLIMELSTRAASHLGSLQHLMALTGDIDDPESELKRVLGELRVLQSLSNQNPQETHNARETGNRGSRSGEWPGSRGQ